MTTNYISYFCRENGRKREAVCGAWITPREHSAEPTCAACARWLAFEAGMMPKTSDEAFGKEEREQ